MRASRRPSSGPRVRPSRRPCPTCAISATRSAQAAFQALGLDQWTAVAVASHDIAIDHAALAAALPSPAPFVGELGSGRRLPERLARL